ncbi:MAG: GAF domain-containing protein [Deltaproteobacteria bacterium]|nr:GAF domain-containing protein [Deltaproteobacteria bacterium]
MRKYSPIEDELDKLNKQLEQRVIELTAQLEITNRHLKEEIIEHKKDEKRLTLKYSITNILSEFNDPKEALTRTLKAICENGWEIGEIWFIDKGTNILTLNSMWYNPPWDVKEFEAVSREITFPKGIGLPGRVWENGQPAWINDVIVDRNFLRESIASKLGLHGAFAFPIKISGNVAGVMSFYSRSIEPPDNDLLQMFDVIGAQIGGFIARKQVEEELQRMQNIESIGVLSGGIAHDFNNLLTAILGNISLSKLYLSKKNISPDDNVFKRLAASEESCEHAKEITSMLITFARGGKPIKEPIEISKLLKETTTLLIPGDLHITCEFDIPAHLYPVKADKLQIKQVIKSIVANAIEAMPDGGIIRVKADNIEIGKKDNLQLKDEKYIKVSVEDSGVGIPEENLSKIFDPYFTTKEKGLHKGMGLGLSICYSIINRHEGLITVDSKVGVGTTFHFYLPANLEGLRDASHISSATG